MGRSIRRKEDRHSGGPPHDLTAMPDTRSYIGQQAYWQSAVADKKK
jgi:hypothetical protein